MLNILMSKLSKLYSLREIIFFYKTFLQEGEKSLTLTNAISFLPLARSSQMLEYYKNLDVDKLCDGVTEIVAMDFGE